MKTLPDILELENGHQHTARPSTLRFKKKKPKAPAASIGGVLGEAGMEARDFRWGIINRGLAGQGMAPGGFYGMQQEDILGAINSQFQESVQNQATRTGRFEARDPRIAQFTQGTQQQMGGLLRDDVVQGFQEQRAQDREGAMLAAQEEAARAKKIGIDLTSQRNQQMAQMQQMELSQGNFYSNLAQGIGGGLGWVSAGQRYGQMMSGTA